MIKRYRRMVGRLIRRGRAGGKIGMSEEFRMDARIKISTLLRNNWISEGSLWRKIRANEVLFHMGEPILYIACDPNYRIKIAGLDAE